MHSSSPGLMGVRETAERLAEFLGKTILRLGTHEWLRRATDANRAVPWRAGQGADSSCSSVSPFTSARAWAMAAPATAASAASSSMLATSIPIAMFGAHPAAVSSTSSPKMPVVSSPHTHFMTHSFSRSRRSRTSSSATAWGFPGPAAASWLPRATKSWPTGDGTSTSMLLYSNMPSTSEKNQGPDSNNTLASSGACSASACCSSAAASVTRPRVCSMKS
mmetsp:Transcript_93490/g.243513  ORF Transcript_93490/g.243513 Transcript_93490/m.243513 type:complete len:220 (+) Transcript_93490:53-712(+)